MLGGRRAMNHCKPVLILSWLALLITSQCTTRTANALNYVVIGDWGVDNSNQVAVAQAMSTWCSPTVRGPCAFIVNTGDNFYPDGVTSVDDPRFENTWRSVYDLPNINQLVWYQTVGNHDYGIRDSRELYQVDFSQSNTLWYFPWLWYDFFKVDPVDETVVHFIAIDTQSLILGKHDAERQLEWLEEVLARSTADWKIIVGHYPPYSTGNYAPGTVMMRDLIVPLCNKYDVDMFFSGHDHNLQHITSANVTDYVISGGGGRGLYEYSPAGERILNDWGLNVDYFGYHHGFVAMEMTKTTLIAEFLDAELNVRYSFSRNK